MVIFKPFIDGIIEYDCSSCPRNCCRIESLLVNKNEAEIIKKEATFLKDKIRRINKHTFSLRRYPRGKCWFLNNRRFCSLEAKYGYMRKPLMCRVYPYTLIGNNNGYIMTIAICPTMRALKNIRFNPLRKIPGRAGDRNLRNVSFASGREPRLVGDRRWLCRAGSTTDKTIIKNAKEAIQSGIANDGLNWTKERMGLEKKILRESAQYLARASYVGFAIRQIQLSNKEPSPDKIKQLVYRNISLWRRFLKINGISMNSRDLTYELTAITSILRSLKYHIDAKEISEALLALYIFTLMPAFRRREEPGLQKYAKALEDRALQGLPRLKDNLETRLLLLSYAKAIKKKSQTLLINEPTLKLAERLNLNKTERIGFLRFLRTRKLKRTILCSRRT